MYLSILRVSPVIDDAASWDIPLETMALPLFSFCPVHIVLHWVLHYVLRS